MDDPGTLRVVVVTYSPGASLRSFLSSLRGATTLPYTVVLADNGSTDGAPAAAAGPGVRLLETGSNLGYGGAASLGALGGHEPWLVVANPDVVWEPGALDELLAGGAVASRGLPRPGDPHAGGGALPVRAGVPVPRPGHRARAVRVVVAHEPLDPFLPGRGRPAEGGADRVAVRLADAAAA